MQERKTNGIGYLAGDWPLDPEKSTIVFIHGAGGSGVFWQAQVEGLAARANTLAIDLPGHGKSDGEGKGKVEDYARAVANFMKEINVPNPIPCGLSMGGAITQLLLIDYRDLVKAGVLVSTGSRLKVAPAIFEIIEKNYSDYVDMICSFAASEKTDPGLLVPFKKETARCKPEIAHGDFRACDRFDVTERLSAIDVPVLVVTAEDDKLTPPKYGEALEKGIKNATRAHIMAAGHIVPMEKSDEINKTILRFLDQTGL
ncbi:MAG: alpha/beta hydrolase [Deltaproteobacteria bacterium]|nr:alpha/beta hydrolase [Deltaproteobacteria bacterium]